MGMSWMKAFQFFGGTGVGGWGTQNIFKPNSAINIPPAALGIDFQGAQYGPPITVLYGQNKIAGNVIDYDGFAAQATTASGGKGGGGTPTGYTYSASFLLALCEGVASSIVTAYDGTTAYTAGNGPLSGNFFATGTSGQTPWSHLSGGRAIGYDRTCLYGYANYPLGTTPSLPNLNFEVAGLKQFGGGIVDANPADIFSDICTDPNHGINFNFLGSLTQYSNYCVANGIFLSPIYNTQSTGQQALSDLLTYTNSEAFFSENQLKIVPRGDTSVTGNGVTFTPVRTIQYQFDATNILTSNKGDPLVAIDRKPPANCRNIVRLSFNDRGYTYTPSSVIASIDYDILVNGARAEQDQSYAGITTGSVAKIVAQNLLQAAFYIRNTYTWKVPWRFCDLEPMDLVEITDPDQGLNNAPVRVTSVDEDEYGVLTIVGEEYPEGIGYAVMYPVEPNAGTNQDMTVDPGPVQAPYIVRGPGLLVQNTAPEIWIAVTGTNPPWGGCTSYISYDGVTYQPVNQIARQALYGIVALPVWVAANVQKVGQLIQDSSGNTQRIAAITGDAKTGGSAPAWASTVGTTTTDNHVTWVCVAVKLAVPAAPGLTDTAAGALLATTYFSFCTWVDQYGRETTAGAEASHVTAANRVLNVAQPASPPAGAVSWRVYVSNTVGGGSGHETLQTTLPIATTTWVEPATGLVVGATAPITNTTGLFSLPASGDPDAVNIPRVYLYRGQMLGGSQTDADNFATLSMLDTELVSYEGATLASDGGYDLSYIRRGGYNSTIAAHISGAPFVRFDQNIVRIPVDPSLIGKQVWLKFLSVNIFNRTPRTLAGETAYTYVVGTNQETPDVPTTVSSLTAKAAADTVALSWTNPSDLAVGATSIEVAPTWEPFNTYAVGFILYDQATNTTQQVSAITTGISGNYPVPTFASILGNTVVDSGVTWKCIFIGPTVQTNLGTPATPMISALPGVGPANTYFFKITYLDQYGLESLPSAEVSATITGVQNVQLSLTGPPPVGAVSWRIYANTTTGTEKQMTAYLNLPITQASQITTSTTINAVAPPTFDQTAQGGFSVLHTVVGAQNHYKYTQDGDQENAFRIRQRGQLAQAGWGPYSGVVSAINANSVRRNSKLGSANMLLDPNFLRTRFSGDFTFWTYDNVKYTINMTNSAEGAQCADLINGALGTNLMFANEYVPVNPNNTVYARCRISYTGAAGNIVFGVQFYDHTFTVVTNLEAAVPAGSLSGTWTTFGQFFQVPSGCSFVRFYLRGGTSMTAGAHAFINNCFLSIQDYAAGSTPTTVCNTTLSYSSTPTSVSVSWSGFVLKLPDGTNPAIASGSQNNTGLPSGAHSYFTYPSYDIAKQGALGGVTFQLGGSGSPGTCYTAVNTGAFQAQNNLNMVPLSTGAFQVSTPASGVGGGSGGGSAGGTGGCLHGKDPLRIRRDGREHTIPAELLENGDEVWTPHGWSPVSEVEKSTDSAWFIVVTCSGQRIMRTPQHRIYDMRNQEVRVDALRLGQLVQAEGERVRIMELKLDDDPAIKVTFTVEGHEYFAVPDGMKEHNANGKP